MEVNNDVEIRFESPGLLDISTHYFVVSSFFSLCKSKAQMICSGKRKKKRRNSVWKYPAARVIQIDFPHRCLLPFASRFE
ncbi:hypothetical protein DdX_18496 [Ditylenchus destructor]|uniref:Uncharacterized protein n=1 Tax=Ditylenchus destructor TaxID=166010 RepID=A0AAD4ML27_9BILA|nr:hypothetical protein DdX_18496 [Ditylenchus destructor]